MECLDAEKEDEKGSEPHCKNDEIRVLASAECMEEEREENSSKAEE